MLGFELRESLSGSWYRLDDPLHDRAIWFRHRIGTTRLRRFLRDRRLEALGAIWVEGLAEREPSGCTLEGSLDWRLLDERRIPYDLRFEGDDGKVYRLRGQRDFFVHDAIDSLTVLPASIFDETGAELGRATLRFDARRELPATLKSIRPRLSRPRWRA